MDRNNFGKLRLVAGLALVLAGPVALGGCVVAAGDQPPAGSRVAYYEYYYYPQWEVYFEPQGGYWHYNDGRQWRHERYLPSRYRVDQRNRVVIRDRDPWTHHNDYRRRYPGDRDRDGRDRVAVYEYYYYPQWEVYFEPQGGYWHYNDGRQWRRERYLPSRYRVDQRNRVVIRDRDPWTHHNDYRRRYPGDRDRDGHRN